LIARQAGKAERGPLMEARGLSLGYGRAAVLSGLSLSLGRGEGPLALCGPNGAGKSTFLRACLGIIRPLAGTLEVLGGPAAGGGRAARLRRIGYVPQARPGGGLRVSARELASMGIEAARGPLRPLRAEDRKAVDMALERCAMLDLASVPVDELSGGQYQRVLLARSLAPAPELLLLDEPGAHLDAASREAVLSLMRELAASGDVGIIAVSHDRGLLESCARFIHFEAGEAREVDAPLGGDDA
jgi:ABC-type Mn2+/Zn2+ transport system ATPase subunit